MLYFAQVQVKDPGLRAGEGESATELWRIIPTPYDLQDLMGRHEYMEYFEDKAKASLRAKC